MNNIVLFCNARPSKTKCIEFTKTRRIQNIKCISSLIVSKHVKLLEVLLQHDLEVQDVKKTSGTSIYFRYMFGTKHFIFSWGI